MDLNALLWFAMVLAVLATTTPILITWMATRGPHRVGDVGTMFLAIVLAALFGIPAIGCGIIGLMI